MKLHQKEPPRKFKVGQNDQIEISDCGDIELKPNEQVTFVTDTGSRFDFARKDWGFYATPSINGRLKREGFKTALVKNENNQFYIMVVESIKMNDFEKYCKDENQIIEEWLDEKK